jgi:hypothetical protein
MPAREYCRARQLHAPLQRAAPVYVSLPMPTRPAIGRRLLVTAIAVAVGFGVVASTVLPGLAEGTAYLLPALLLLLALAARRYPGELALLALMDRRRRRRHGGAGDRCRESPRRGLVPRGGALIAFSLAERPPPLAAGG